MQKIAAAIRNPTIQADVYRSTYTQETTSEYTGVYEVIPKTAAQTLQTKDKKMIDDVSVHAIPYYEVGNDADGITAIIGDELNYGN